jgi:hypothetical protein
MDYLDSLGCLLGFVYTMAASSRPHTGNNYTKKSNEVLDEANT